MDSSEVDRLQQQHQRLHRHALPPLHEDPCMYATTWLTAVPTHIIPEKLNFVQKCHFCGPLRRRYTYSANIRVLQLKIDKFSYIKMPQNLL